MCHLIATIQLWTSASDGDMRGQPMWQRTWAVLCHVILPTCWFISVAASFMHWLKYIFLALKYHSSFPKPHRDTSDQSPTFREVIGFRGRRADPLEVRAAYWVGRSNTFFKGSFLCKINFYHCCLHLNMCLWPVSEPLRNEKVPPMENSVFLFPADWN